MEPYPSINELMPPIMLTKIPSSLAKEIEERYRTLGEKYLTEETTEDGRRINACMNNDSVQDAIEEVVDAVFNCLVWIFKSTNISQPIRRDNQIVDVSIGSSPPDSAYACLSGLIEIYSLMSAERAMHVRV